jgi:hypothetical protein
MDGIVYTPGAGHPPPVLGGRDAILGSENPAASSPWTRCEPIGPARQSRRTDRWGAATIAR